MRTLTVGAMVCGLVLLVLLGPMVWIAARHLDLESSERLAAESDVRSSLLQLIGGSLLAVGLVYTARTVRLTREGHITDRYSSAIEQIGHDRRDVRIGGIFALERIARDSAPDRATVVAVLTAYVRTHTTSAPRTPKADRIDVDVQAALTVLGRRPGIPEETRRLDLTHCGLVGADLSGNFDGALFLYSLLEQAVFTGGSLIGADLSFSKAKTVGVNGLSARGAHFVHAEFVHCWFIDSDLTGADFYGCDLSGSDMGQRYGDGGPESPASRLNGARFTEAKLVATNLGGSDLSGVGGLTPDQLSESLTDANTVLPLFWGDPDEDSTDAETHG
jgi:uncharacterized protein YjbI with pentapeptide repeats